MILILGGTADARTLAEALTASGHDVETSLAGVTTAPRRPSGKVRIGGFGGAEGLARYLAEARVRLLIDATHPFAVIMARHAVEAAGRARVPLLRLERPVWRPVPGDRWTEVADVAVAARAAPAGSRLLLTIGRKEIGPFLARPDLAGVLRMIEPPADPVPKHWSLLLARPPFALEAEESLMREHAITLLVSKNSGGATDSKLQAARRLGIPAIMVARPPKPPADTAADVSEMLAKVERLLGR